MPAAELTELAKAGPHEKFESRCLELLEAGDVTPAQLLAAYRMYERENRADQLAMLTPMLVDIAGDAADPHALLDLVRITLVGSPKSDELRNLAVTMYRRAHGDDAGFDAIMDASGLAGGRPVRSALRLLDLCLMLKPGDALISRADDRVVEVTEIDRVHGLFTLRREGRVTTRPAPEVAREYDGVASDDFRVLRALRPEKLTELIAKDPVAVVIGLIHAHGGMIDADLLKAELVPRHIETGDWTGWWSKARTKLKRNQHVIIEGRSPMILSHDPAGRTLEEETWEQIEASADPVEWLRIMEGYLREKKSRKESPADELVGRFEGHILASIAAVRERRPTDALACALSLNELADKGLAVGAGQEGLAAELLREASDPAEVLLGIEHQRLRERGLETLRQARPDDWATHTIKLLGTAPAGLLDSLIAGAIEAGRVDEVQSFIDQGLADMAHYPELMYWLWKGTRQTKDLRVPEDADLFRDLLNALSTLGRSVSAEDAIVREFRVRVRAALALRGFARVRKCLESTSEAAAITIRRQIDRLEGMGDNVRLKMLDMLRDVHPQLWVVKKRTLAPWEDLETVYCTPEGLARRTAERDDILNVQMRENAKRIGEAASHGDLSENSEYKFALEERDFLRGRLAKYNDELSRARTISTYDVPTDQIGIGSRVTLSNATDGSTRTITFLGPFETDVDRDIYSYQAPLSQGLMGHQVGDHVKLTADGHEQEYEIVACENALAADVTQE